MPTQVVTRWREHRKLVGVVPKGGGAELRCPFLPVTKFEMQSSENSAAWHLAVCADQGRHGVSPSFNQFSVPTSLAAEKRHSSSTHYSFGERFVLPLRISTDACAQLFF